jgi:hypothetical protein
MNSFYYCCLHVPTGHKRYEKVQYNGRLLFLEDLNRWNQSGAGTWVHWEVMYLTYEKETGKPA